MSFEGDVKAFAAKVARRTRDIHNGVADLAYLSITKGSEVTGAPGQPVDTGYLLGSWQNLIDGPLTRRIVTKVAYAPVIEENTRAAFEPAGEMPPPKAEEEEEKGGGTRRIKSTVGGHHSVALTRLGWQRIVDTVTAGLADA